MGKRKWSRQTVIEAIRQWQQQGLPINRLRRGNRRLYSALFHYFPNLAAALRAAGIAPAAPRRPRAKPTRRSAQAILQELQRRHAQGLPVTQAADPGLSAAARGVFGTWINALEAAGIPCRRRQKWSRERVLDQLRRWDAEGRFDNSTWLEDRTFVDAAYRLFGSWPAALVAAGVLAPGERMRRRTKWPKQRIVEVIQDRHVRGQAIEYGRDDGLIGAAIVRFGSWYEAKRAAGVPVSPGGPRTRWSRDVVIQKIRDRRKRGQSLVNVYRTDGRLACAGQRYFGSWHGALVAARAIPADTPKRESERWTRERVLRELRSRHREGRCLHCTWPDNHRLASAACRLFGGWRAALRAAKVPGAPPPYQIWNRQRVLDEIQSRQRHGRPLGKQAVGQGFYCAAVRRFGSWRAALMAAGVVPPPQRERWSRQRVVDEIRAQYRQGLSVTYGAPENGRLGAAAQARFGSWRAALTAAGIPGSYGPRQRWSRQRILDELQVWRDRGTVPTRRDVGSAMQSAAYRYFGSWREALVAAGVVRGGDAG